MKISTLTAGTALGAAMTANERHAGRFLRDDAGHPAGEAAPAAAPGTEGADPGADVTLVQQEPKSAEALLEEEFRDPNTDPEPAAKEPGEGDPAPAKDPNEGDPKPPVVEKSPAVIDAERRAADATRDAEFWRAKALEGAKPAEKPAAGQPDPNAEPDPEKYEFGEADAKYIKDLASYEVRTQMAQQTADAAQNAELARLEANWQGNIGKVVERLPDFNEKVVQTAEKGEWPCPPIVSLGIRDSSVGPDIAYHLATNIGEAKRIAALDPYQQAREFGKLEYRFQAEETARSKPPAPVKVSETPAPPSSQVRGSGGKFATAADTEDFASFEKMADGVLTKR